MARTRVDQAGSDLAAKGVVQTGLVAADAGVDVLCAARGSLVDELRVCQEGARHAHHVGLATGQHFFGHLRGVDAVGGHQRNTYFALELLRDPGKRGARHLGGNGGNARLVPANAGVQDGHARLLQRLRELHHFGLRGAAFDQIEHGQAEDDDEVGAHPGARAAHDLQREADAVFVAAAPCVVTLVGLCGNEFVDEVALRAHDLHAVVARALRERGGIGVVFDRLLHLRTRQRMGAEWADGGLQATRRHQLGVVGVTAKVQDLHADLATRVMHRLGHHLVLVGLGLRGHGRATRHGAGAFVGRNATGHDQPHAATRALGIEGGHALEALGGFFQPHVHGAHEHAVLERGEAQIQGREQVGISGHGVSLSSWVVGRRGWLAHYATSCTKVYGRSFNYATDCIAGFPG